MPSTRSVYAPIIADCSRFQQFDDPQPPRVDFQASELFPRPAKSVPGTVSVVRCAAREYQTRPIGYLRVGVLISSGSWSASIESLSSESQSSGRDVIPGTNYSRETALKRAENSAAPSDFPIRVAQRRQPSRKKVFSRLSCPPRLGNTLSSAVRGLLLAEEDYSFRLFPLFLSHSARLRW